MKLKHTILRNMAFASAREPFHAEALTAPSSIVPHEPTIETDELSHQDIQNIARYPEIVGIAPIMPTKLITPISCESSSTNTWGIEAVKAAESQYSGKGTSVAVLDTGIDAKHPAFSGVNLIEKDFSGSGNGDHNGHGTHCAGTIFGRDVDGTRIGIARGVNKALIGKVLSNNGGGDSNMIFRGIQWAVSHSVDVISMSLGFDFPGFVNKLVNAHHMPADLATSMALEGYRANLRMFDSLMRMIKAQMAFGDGTVMVAAAGNESKRNVNPEYKISVSLPAAADDIISVGALEQKPNGLSIAYFSNTLPIVSAPGVKIISAKVGGGLHALSGTSMACPHVAGVAALWWDAIRNSSLRSLGAKASAVQAKLLANTKTSPLASDVDPADRGYGLVMAP